MNKINEVINLLSDLSDLEKFTLYKILREQLENDNGIEFMDERSFTLNQVKNGEKIPETVSQMFTRLGL